MEYVYMGLWFVCGLLMIFRFGRENSIFYWLGGFFFFLGLWWLMDILLPVKLFEGVWPWVLRAVSACALGAAVWAYYKEKKKTASEQKLLTEAEQENLGQEAASGPEVSLHASPPPENVQKNTLEQNKGSGKTEK